MGGKEIDERSSGCGKGQKEVRWRRWSTRACKVGYRDLMGGEAMKYIEV